MANMENIPGLLTEGQEYKYDLRWLVKKLLSFENDLKTAIDLQTIVYADPIDWSIAEQYARNTVVLDKGIAYLSKQPVPKGIAITNTDYWQSIFDLTPVIDNGIKPYFTDTNLSTATTNTGAVLRVGDWFWHTDNNINALCYTLKDIPTNGALVLNDNYKIFATLEVFLKNQFYGDVTMTAENATANVAGDLTVVTDDFALTATDKTEHIHGDAFEDVKGSKSVSAAGLHLTDTNGLKIERVYPTVADMKAAIATAGDTVKTLGYYDAGDGGGATYQISAEGNAIKLNNGLYANIVIQDVMSPLQFGDKTLNSVFSHIGARTKVKTWDLGGVTWQWNMAINSGIPEDAATTCIRNGGIEIYKDTFSPVATLTIAKTGFLLDNVSVNVINGFGTAGHYRSYISMGSGATVRNCYFTGITTGKATTDSDGMLEVTGSGNKITNCTFENLGNNFKNTDDILIRCINATGSVLVDSCTFRNVCQGIGSSTNVTVRNCSFTDVTDNGVYLFGDSEIYDSVFTRCEEAVVSSANLMMQGCAFIDNGNTSCSFGGDGTNTIRMIDCQSIRAKSGAADRQFVIRSNGSINSFTAINCNFTENAESNGTGLFQFGARVKYTTFIGCFLRTRLNGWSTFLVDAGNTVEFYNCTCIATTAGSLTSGKTVTVGSGFLLNCRHGQATIRNIPTVQANTDAALGNAYVIATNAKPTVTTGVEAGSLAINSGSSATVGWRFNGTAWIDIT